MLGKNKKRKKNKKEINEDKYKTKVFKNIEEEPLGEKEVLFRKAKKKNKKSVKIKIKKFFIIITCVIILVIGIWLGLKTHTWNKLMADMVSNENSIVLDVDGNTIAKLGGARKSKPISLDNMSDNLKNAYISIEDERFYSHNGIDIKRTGGAIFSYIFSSGSGSYGGSTITQQLVKNLTGDSSDSIVRKIKEWWKAIQLENFLSKDEILDGYLNIIYAGPNIYGVEAASIYYFNKSSSELTLEECAFLAGLNNSPNSYNPFTGNDNVDRIKNRTKTVLYKMLELKYIDEESYNQALAKVEVGLKFKKGDVSSSDAVYSYHTDALITEIIRDIANKYNISEVFAANYINMAGLTIQSTQDSKVQTQIEVECKKSKYSIASKNGGNSSQAAMVVIDHKTGNVVGCVGGLGEKTEVRPLNRATQAIRQTGSAIKPLAVLIPGINKRIITAATILDDTRKNFADGYHPTNYEGIELGKITVRRALESSQNIPFVEMMEEVKPKNSIKYLERMGITTLTEGDNNLALALGGISEGISPLEMAGAYATIANDGKYIEPTFYIEISNKSEKVIVKSKQKEKRVFSKEVAYILKNLLTEPVEGSHGTATYCKIPGMDVAAKTGTSDNDYDRWLCGFTAYYTAVTWYGYDQNETIVYNGKNPSGIIWANVMIKIHNNLKNASFEKPSAMSSATICAETGQKANTGCTNTYTEYFLWFTVPGTCSKHNSKSSNNTNNNKSNNTNNNKVQVLPESQDIEIEEKPKNENTNTNNQNNSNTNKVETNTNSNTNTNNTNNNSTNTSTEEDNEPTNTTTNTVTNTVDNINDLQN